ncbi:tRNA (guanosine(37)-N1)-methyltransferase TrmD [Pelolinea submarina]|uniref:tRNA (guanine-N(1)-)-methyltransferase n=1 Tax=Pelolinea submarina TaxID=913107 RepID=A0A347ZV28_9CHLR|nr:tRNA (guanosine(37)-N1)-methyltransferase TrmD [Pelolinea submarina]REG10255.1 tRNA (guanine37-N(1)-) methyltransferase [Pelolinea submarina]BBB49159.1 tRNA (guanine37-N1)-methyltransferase [Pelolinea submarina]
MRFDIFTLFPDVFYPYINTSILQRACAGQIVEINIHNIRDWSTDKHHTTDDTPFGGGGGMVMKPDPIFNAVESVAQGKPDCPVVLMTPQGRQLTHSLAEQFSREPRLMILCGRYEGVDERVRRFLVTDEISMGDYVLSGGELPALVLLEAVTRLLPGALGDPDGAFDDSFANGLLEYPHYTRPAAFRDWTVPDELLSGNHQAIALWRRRQSLLRTLQKRPDLLLSAQLSQQDIDILKELASENNLKIPKGILE